MSNQPEKKKNVDLPHTPQTSQPAVEPEPGAQPQLWSSADEFHSSAQDRDVSMLRWCQRPLRKKKKKETETKCVSIYASFCIFNRLGWEPLLGTAPADPAGRGQLGLPCQLWCTGLESGWLMPTCHLRAGRAWQTQAEQESFMGIHWHLISWTFEDMGKLRPAGQIWPTRLSNLACGTLVQRMAKTDLISSVSCIATNEL